VNTSDDSLPASGKSLQQAFESLVSVLNGRGIRYAIIGGIAALQHTRVRTTDDIDVLVSIPQVAMPGFFEALHDSGFTLELTKSVKELRDEGITSIRYGTVLIDLLRPVIPVYMRVLDRAVDAEILRQHVRIISAEGLIVTKLIAMRPQDEIDIQEVLRSYSGRLDLDYIRSEFETFTNPDDPRRVKFEEWVRLS
jgi:predicted nucleotidyltransferase